MGAWGHKLYDSDVACDVRDAFKDLSRLPIDGAALVDLALARHPNAADPTDDDHTVFWLALADQFHRHGIAHPPVFERAFAIVDEGLDDRLMAALEMDPVDRRRRAKNLADLRRTWALPHPKPVKRKVLTGPEPHVVAPGEIWAYPTMEGNPPNTFYPEAEIAKMFQPDGWAAFAIGAVGHQLGYFALAYYIRLHVDGPDKPDLEACRRAHVSGVRYVLADPDGPPAHAVAWGTVTKGMLRKMRADRLGVLPLSWERIRARLHGTDDIAASGRGSLSGGLWVYWPEWEPGDIGDHAVPLDILVQDLLA